MTIAHVPSRTTAGIAYAVAIHDDGSTACSCPAGQHNKLCWHAKAVRAELARRAAEQQRAGLERFIATYRDKLANHPENASHYAAAIADAERKLAALG